MFFRLKKKEKYEICIHATSIGEITLALKIIERLFPSNRVFVSTSTKKSYVYLSEKAREKKNIGIGYLPIDVYWNASHFVNQLNFSQLFIIEHDMWPNLLKVCQKQGIKRYLLNAYIKKDDYRNFLKWPFLVPLLFNFDEIYVQNKRVKRQLRLMNLPSSTLVKSVGNFKTMREENLETFHLLGLRDKVIVLGSFHEGEEKIWMDYVGLDQRYTLVIIPRHLEVLDRWFHFFKSHGKTQLYSCYEPDDTTDFLIVDSMGLSLKFYSLAHLVVIGDSFIPTMGGHNVIEPLFFLKPVIYGNYLKTFSDITNQFEKKGIFHRVNKEELRKVVNLLIEDKALYQRLVEQIRVELNNVELDLNKLDFLNSKKS